MQRAEEREAEISAQDDERPVADVDDAHHTEDQGQPRRHQGVDASGQDAENGRLKYQAHTVPAKRRGGRRVLVAVPTSQVMKEAYGQFGFGYSGFLVATVVGYTKTAEPPCHCSMYTPTPPCGLPTLSKDI